MGREWIEVHMFHPVNFNIINLELLNCWVIFNMDIVLNILQLSGIMVQQLTLSPHSRKDSHWLACVFFTEFGCCPCVCMGFFWVRVRVSFCSLRHAAQIHWILYILCGCLLACMLSNVYWDMMLNRWASLRKVPCQQTFVCLEDTQHLLMSLGCRP